VANGYSSPTILGLAILLTKEGTWFIEECRLSMTVLGKFAKVQFYVCFLTTYSIDRKAVIKTGRGMGA
jgi:hypothetical protein